jgi:hypothetical protein
VASQVVLSSIELVTIGRAACEACSTVEVEVNL